MRICYAREASVVRKREQSMKTNKPILFVENDPVALAMYRNRLEREEFHIETAQDRLEALKFAQFDLDLVVLDAKLPHFTGGEVLQFLRADPKLKYLPVIIFSNTPLSEPEQDVTLDKVTKRLLKTD